MADYTFYEFFAGGGMARLGLGDKWQCLFANDIDRKKAATYADNFGDEELVVDDISNVSSDDILGTADLAWASFPCQDLSLAGNGAGLKGERSGTFWPFWKHMQELSRVGRAPRTIVLENVYGALTSHGGKDFAAIGTALAKEGYSFGAVVMDAVDFLPQSRPRLFIVGVSDGIVLPDGLQGCGPSLKWHPKALVEAYERLPEVVQNKWIWWDIPCPSPRNQTFADVLDENPEGVEWHTPEETKRLLSMMTEVNAAKVETARKSGRLQVGGLYKRTRNGVQRAEVRFDEVAGCLRTPSGGSSRQTIIWVEGENVRSRLLSPREAARLMGLPEWYRLPSRYNEAYHLAGDGVVVPVVRHIARHIIEPILKAMKNSESAA